MIYNRNVVPTRVTRDEIDITVAIIASRQFAYTKQLGNLFLCKNLNGTTLLDYQISLINNVYPKADIVVVSGYMCEKLHTKRNNKYRVVENQLFDQTNEFEDIRLIVNNIYTNNLILINGHLMFNKVCLQYNGQSSLLYKDGDNKQELGLTILDGNVTRIDFGLNGTIFDQICCLNRHELDILRKFIHNKDKNKLMLSEVLNMIMENGGSFLAKNPSGHQLLKLNKKEEIDYYVTQSIL